MKNDIITKLKKNMNNGLINNLKKNHLNKNDYHVIFKNFEKNPRILKIHQLCVLLQTSRAKQ
jgi:hypothetical protein